MSNEDHRARFLENYEKYVAAKHRGEAEHIGFLALLALKEIHHISDVPAHADREANVQVRDPGKVRSVAQGCRYLNGLSLIKPEARRGQTSCLNRLAEREVSGR